MSEALDLLYGIRLEDGTCWGECATDWQRADAAAFLDASGPRSHFWTRPRGASKTSDAGFGSTVALVAQLPPGARGYCVAADRDQAALLVQAVDGARRRTEALRGAIDIQQYKIVATRSGATLEIVASDDASSWGLRPHLIVISEFAAWPDVQSSKRLWRSLFSSLPKVPTSRLLIETNAGDPSHFAHDVLVHAKAQPDRWRVSEVPGGPCPWIAEADLVEQRATLPRWEYERLHLNTWAEPDDRLTTLDALQACIVLDGPLPPQRGITYVVGLDVGVVNDRTAVVVAHGEPVRRDGAVSGVRVVVDRLQTWQGSRSLPVQLVEVGEIDEVTAGRTAEGNRTEELRPNLLRHGNRAATGVGDVHVCRPLLRDRHRMRGVVGDQDAGDLRGDGRTPSRHQQDNSCHRNHRDDRHAVLPHDRSSPLLVGARAHLADAARLPVFDGMVRLCDEEVKWC
jgi:hypothetical protein